MPKIFALRDRLLEVQESLVSSRDDLFGKSSFVDENSPKDNGFVDRVVDCFTEEEEDIFVDNQLDNDRLLPIPEKESIEIPSPWTREASW